jgi:hypothetical protein
MLSKNNSKILLIVLLVLVALFLIKKYTDHSDSTIINEIVTVDTAQIDKIVIYPPKGAAQIVLEKKENNWKVKSKNEEHVADKRKIKSILADMLRLNPISVVGTEKSQWKKFEVDDSLSTRVKLMKNDKVKADVLLGKFNFIQAQNAQPNPYQRRPQGEMISYVRPYNDVNTYSVEGMIRMNFSADADNYRDKTFVKADQSAINKIDFNYGNSGNFTLTKEKKYWKIDHEPVDSATVVRYLRYLSRTSGSKIVHNFDQNRYKQIGTINIGSTNGKPVTLTAFADSSNYVVHSSQNPDTYFDGNAAKLFDKFFVGKDYFFKKKEKKNKK